MIKTSIIYNHRGRFGKDGTAPVEIRVTIDRKPCYINTGVRLKPKNFKFGRCLYEDSVPHRRADGNQATLRLKKSVGQLG